MERWEYEQFIQRNIDKIPLDLLKVIYYLVTDNLKRKGK